ncbi:hypothetical protein BH10ACI3_BH10ACI3_12080 [soil metagenome]
MEYDAFNNLTSRSTQTYSLPAVSFPASGDSVDRDAAGNVVASSSTGASLLVGGSAWQTDTKLWNYDAAGRMQRWEEDGPWGAYEKRGGETAYDGDGRAVKRVDLQKRLISSAWQDSDPFNWYYLYSSVTGQKITDLIGWDGSESIGNRVYMGDSVIYDTTFKATIYDDNSYTGIGFTASDPITGSTQDMPTSGEVPADTSTSQTRNELAGLGTSIPAVAPTPTATYAPNYHRGGYAGNAGSGCILNGFESTPRDCRDALAGHEFAGGHIVFAKWDETYGREYVRFAGFEEHEIDNRFAIDRLSELRTFLNNNRNCAELLYNLSSVRLGVIDARDSDNPLEIFLATLNFVDATSNNSAVFNQPKSEGGVKSLGQDANENGVAARGSENGDIHVFDKFFSMNLDHGFTLFHEVLHVLLGTHIGVARALELGYEPLPIPANSTEDTPFRTEMLNRQAEQKNRRANDDNAQGLMDKFIMNHCNR